jgi:hypothetical protein
LLVKFNKKKKREEEPPPEDGTPVKVVSEEAVLHAVALILHEGVDHVKYGDIHKVDPRIYIIKNPYDPIEELGRKRNWLDFRVKGRKPCWNYGYKHFYNQETNTLYSIRFEDYKELKSFTFNYLKGAMMMLGYSEGAELDTDYEEFKQLVCQYMDW